MFAGEEKKKVLLLGSGFVALPCVNQLLKRNNIITIGCRNPEAIKSKFKDSVCIKLDVDDTLALEDQVSKHDIVISLIPYIHHTKVIKACIKYKKNVVTTSYVSPAMEELNQQCIDANITSFNEIGVDPGVDHLYAIKMIDSVHKQGGKITSFLSYCGGLPAPECSNNPLGYKFSWSSRGVLLALRNDAKYIEGGEIKEVKGIKLMDTAKPIDIYPAFAFLGYPNRDSSPYTKRYNIPECRDLIRGTLRYSCFPKFVKVLVALGFLSEEPLSYLNAEAQKISWVYQFNQKSVLSKIVGLKIVDGGEDEVSLIARIVEVASIPKEDQRQIIAGLRWLGFFSSNLVHQRGNLLDTLCATMDELMQYGPEERDMVILQHRFEIEFPTHCETRTSTGLWYGVPGGESAMARTVGVPCAIATQMILDGKITKKGVLAPMTIDLCLPLIEECEKEGITMIDQIV